MAQDASALVITLDGPAATGKSTVGDMVAQRFGFKVLNSGMLYRAVGHLCIQNNCLDEPRLWRLVASRMRVSFADKKVFISGTDVTTFLKSDEVGRAASLVSQQQSVRDEIMETQLSMRQLPGLVADGRDMGDIFLGYVIRFFLTASTRVKATRRVREYIKDGRAADFDALFRSIAERDRNDTERTVSPLRPHPKAMIIDTDILTPAEVANLIIDEVIKQHKGVVSM